MTKTGKKSNRRFGHLDKLGPGKLKALSRSKGRWTQMDADFWEGGRLARRRWKGHGVITVACELWGCLKNTQISH